VLERQEANSVLTPEKLRDLQRAEPAFRFESFG
jgi:hypothetical protein